VLQKVAALGLFIFIVPFNDQTFVATNDVIIFFFENYVIIILLLEEFTIGLGS
jgi:hypothetical protein